MIQVYYNLKAIAYCAYDGKDEIVLSNDSINFYDGDGVIATINCSKSISFTLSIEKDFSFRKKENFTKDEVFAIRQKKGCYETNSKYKLYIPSKDVNLVGRGKKTTLGFQQILQYNFSFWEIDVADADTPLCEDFSMKGNRLLFRQFINAENSEKGNHLEKLRKEIYETCSIDVNVYDLAKIAEHFSITKKETPNEQAQNKALP